MMNALFDIGMTVKSQVDNLSDELGLPVTMSCAAEAGMVVKYTAKSRDPNIKNIYQEGFVFSYLSSAAGLAYIAATQANERKNIVGALKASTLDQKDVAILDAPNLNEKLNSIGERGYAFVWGQLNGISALAVPILRDGNVLGALSVRSSDLSLRERSMVNRYLEPLSKAAAAIVNGL